MSDFWHRSGIAIVPRRIREEQDDNVEDPQFCIDCQVAAEASNQNHKANIRLLMDEFETYVSRQSMMITSLINWGPVSPSFDPNDEVEDRVRSEVEKEGVGTEREELQAEKDGEAEKEDLKVEIEVLKRTNLELRKTLQSEVQLRKRIHNELQDAKGKIRVFVRIRPISTSEIEGGCSCVFLKDGGEGSLVALPDDQKRLEMKNWDFNCVFGGVDGQGTVFEEVKGLIASAIDGHNVCLFAYGQTGSGKTHTMFGGKGGTAAEAGIAPRAAQELFQVLEQKSSMTSGQVCSVQMYELYNDTLFDLQGRDGGTKVTVKFGVNGATVVGAASVVANNKDELLELLNKGSVRRRTSSTAMNADSSRSHMIVSIVVSTVNKFTGRETKGKVTIVDLAGSERLSKLGRIGEEQLKETRSINKSLSALGDVISSLTAKAKHVPYRNHPLTMLLSDSLGGSSKTLLFVNISPSDYNRSESISTLDFGFRCKGVGGGVGADRSKENIRRDNGGGKKKGGLPR